MQREPAPDFHSLHTEKRIWSELIPLLDQIAATEFRGIVMVNPNVDEDRQELDDSANMMIAILSGFVNDLKEMYFNYGKKVSAMVWADSREDFNSALDTFRQK